MHWPLADPFLPSRSNRCPAIRIWDSTAGHTARRGGHPRTGTPVRGGARGGGRRRLRRAGTTHYLNIDAIGTRLGSSGSVYGVDVREESMCVFDCCERLEATDLVFLRPRGTVDR